MAFDHTPTEYEKLLKQPLPDPLYCRCCGFPIEMPLVPRGIYQSWWRRLFNLPYCAIICRRCCFIGAWEKPNDKGA